MTFHTVPVVVHHSSCLLNIETKLCQNEMSHSISLRLNYLEEATTINSPGLLYESFLFAAKTRNTVRTVGLYIPDPQQHGQPTTSVSTPCSLHAVSAL